MDPTLLKPWLDLLVDYGLPLLVTGSVLILAWKYVPKWIDASIETQTSVPVAINKLAASVEKSCHILEEGVADIRELNEHARISGESLDNLRSAVAHGAAAGSKIVNAMRSGAGIDSDVVVDLQKMRSAVTDTPQAAAERRDRARKARRAAKDPGIQDAGTESELPQPKGHTT